MLCILWAGLSLFDGCIFIAIVLLSGSFNLEQQSWVNIFELVGLYWMEACAELIRIKMRLRVRDHL